MVKSMNKKNKKNTHACDIEETFDSFIERVEKNSERLQKIEDLREEAYELELECEVAHEDACDDLVLIEKHINEKVKNIIEAYDDLIDPDDIEIYTSFDAEEVDIGGFETGDIIKYDECWEMSVRLYETDKYFNYTHSIDDVISGDLFDIFEDEFREYMKEYIEENSPKRKKEKLQEQIRELTEQLASTNDCR